MKGNFEGGFQIHRNTPTADAAGGWTESFSEISGESPPNTVLGRLSPISGGEQIRADQEKGVVTYRFSTPSSTDVRVGDRVVKGSRTLFVKAVRRTSRGNRLECVCEEVEI